MSNHLIIRVPVAIVLALMVIITAIVVPGDLASGTPGEAVFRAPHRLGSSEQVTYKYRAEDIRESFISDERAVELIEETFGPEVAAGAKHRFIPAAKTGDPDESVQFMTSIMRQNWCGYQVIDDYATAVRMSANICHSTGSNAANGVWCGLGAPVDSHNANLIQCGYSMGNRLPFKAWYELLPAAPVYLFRVYEGDEFHATVQLDAITDLYFVCVIDNTTGQYYAGEFDYEPDNCAEWIIETPYAEWWRFIGGQFYIGNFGTETFSDSYWWDGENTYITYDIDESKGTDSSHYKITEYTLHNQTLVPSALGADHRSFTVSR